MEKKQRDRREERGDLGEQMQPGVPGIPAPGDTYKVPEGEVKLGERGAAEEVAPRAQDDSAFPFRSGETTLTAAGAVDTNRPADVVTTAGTTELPGSRHSPNILSRQNVVAPQARRPTTTAGQQLVEDEIDSEDER